MPYPTVTVTGPPTGWPGPSAEYSPPTIAPSAEPWTGGTFGYEVEPSSTGRGPSTGGAFDSSVGPWTAPSPSASPDYVDPGGFGGSFAQGLLDDGEQLVIHKAYYSTPIEDIYGFFSPFSGFGMIQKNTVYNDFSIDSRSRRRFVYPDETDLLWGPTGEEPIYYDGAEIVDAKSSEDGSWETFLDFVDGAYINTPFTCYREDESYLDWYDYSEEHFEFGFTYKQEAAEYMQANHLRSINKPWLILGSAINYILADQPYITNASLTSPFTSRYGVSDESPAIIGWWGPDEDGDGVGDTPMYDSGFSADLLPGYQHVSFLGMSEDIQEDLALRFKTKEMVETTSAEFLNSRIQYVINTGYRTVLKRRLTSKSQKVRRFLRREFTSLSGMYPTIFYEPPAPLVTSGAPLTSGAVFSTVTEEASVMIDPLLSTGEY